MVLTEFPPARFVNAMPACHVTPQGRKGCSSSFFLEDSVQFQEEFCRGILSVFRLTKKPTADLQKLRIVSGMD
jgi:hypothetical protein